MTYVTGQPIVFVGCGQVRDFMHMIWRERTDGPANLNRLIRI